MDIFTTKLIITSIIMFHNFLCVTDSLCLNENAIRSIKCTDMACYIEVENPGPEDMKIRKFDSEKDPIEYNNIRQFLRSKLPVATNTQASFTPCSNQHTSQFWAKSNLLRAQYSRKIETLKWSTCTFVHYNSSIWVLTGLTYYILIKLWNIFQSYPYYAMVRYF
jgi:hypothetical protein